MLRSTLVFFLIWIAGLVVRLVMRAASGAQTRPGPSGQWGQASWSQERGSSSNRSQRARSPYEVLEVRPGAPREEVTAAYRRLVQQYHPDRVANLAPEFREVAERRMKEINATYEQLKRYYHS